MRKHLTGFILLLAFTSFTAMAASIKTRAKLKKVDKRRKSNFSYSVGIEALNTQYDLGLNAQGKKENFSSYDATLFGLNLKGNMELYLGSAVSTTTTVALFKSASIVNQVDQFSEQNTLEVSHYEKSNTFGGFEAGQSLNMSFYNKSTDLDIQPYVGMYFGKAVIDLNLDYKYDDLTGPSGLEYLRAKMRDELTYTKLTIGSSFINDGGVYSYVAVSVLQILSGSRSVSSHYYRAFGDTVDTPGASGGNTDYETLYQISLGVGYRF